MGACRRPVSTISCWDSFFCADRPGRAGGCITEIDPYAAMEIGTGCRIGPFVSVGGGVIAGRDCRTGTRASPIAWVAGIHPGARIGQEGFSFATTKTAFIGTPHTLVVQS
jgi:UDP-3-O-[3-hydroxymyristoyl] glucosamine N-acyltransferase